MVPPTCDDLDVLLAKMDKEWAEVGSKVDARRRRVAAISVVILLTLGIIFAMLVVLDLWQSREPGWLLLRTCTMAIDLGCAFAITANESRFRQRMVREGIRHLGLKEQVRSTRSMTLMTEQQLSMMRAAQMEGHSIS